jgi:hypothetical protein
MIAGVITQHGCGRKRRKLLLAWEELEEKNTIAVKFSRKRLCEPRPTINLSKVKTGKVPALN